MGAANHTGPKGKLADRPRSERGVAFLFGTATSTAGLAIGTLDATGITTTAGNLSRGALYTSAYLAILLFTRAFSVPHTARLCERFGIENAYRITVGLGVVSWAIAGSLILAGVPGLPVLLCFAPLFGISGGFAAVLAPIFSKAYIAGKEMAAAYAWMSVIAGVAWATGSAAGGFILNSVQPGWGLVSKAALGIPMFVIVTRIAPAKDPSTPKAHKRVWFEMKKQLTENRQLRRAAILGCGMSLFAAPMVSMIVPIADALRQTPLLPGAGILMASMALGQLSSPYLVSRLSRDREDLGASAIASLACGLLLGAYAIASLFFSDRPELVIWCVIGLGFGGLRFAARALNMGAVTASDTEENSAHVISAFSFSTALVSPFGVLIWGVMINQISADAAVALGGLATAAVAAVFMAGGRRKTG